VPYKIDMGAVYNIPPDRHNASDKKAFVPIQKEMVVDIDMNDYDDVRTCCTGANVCRLCFQYLRVAMDVINVILEEDFDFRNLLWVFSGRRGIHAWVCDEGAREMTNDMRSAVVSYCNLEKGNEHSGVMMLPSPLHPRLKKVFKYMKPQFEKIIIQDHGLLSIDKHREKFLRFLKEEAREKVKFRWAKIDPSGDRKEVGMAMWEVY
jgi:DNA primase small subunit